jgi:flagellar basal-body rod protein FlgC
MNFLTALHTSSSGLTAQRLRMNVISSNLANVNSTRTEEGGPYKRKDVVFQSIPLNQSFDKVLRDNINDEIKKVEVVEIVEDNRDPILKYNPGHPDADEKGYVKHPNINIVEEMVNMISATRSYEAGVTAINATKSMALKALDIGN